MMQYTVPIYQYMTYASLLKKKKKSFQRLRIILVGSVAQNSLMSIKEIDIKHNKRYDFEGYLKTVQ